ncbi:spore gernimation protein [Photobacterium sp. TY1-4]|uniref:spore gernimation protein n=1 Tax=Photobacterium sp. TY1-4 TaxID=2899122 RepID=UPI0021BE745F|nr:spore gernimation protein [Photobacterium sp. TY1-4]UXH99951.1 spore gernimation protein [Photobacterium sp. TY1-4]
MKGKAGIGLAMFGFAMVSTLLSGCSEPLEVTVTPTRDVDHFQVTAQTNIDMYCPTGICKFELAASQKTAITVNMHYTDARSFDKIEGVNVTGRQGATVAMVDDNTFSLTLAGENETTKIQVVDYYRY